VIEAGVAESASVIEALGMRAFVCDSIMRGPEDAARFAKLVLDHASGWSEATPS
jgi:hypothetical protein